MSDIKEEKGEAMDDKKEDVKVEPQEPEKVKVGEKEYTQEELTSVVGLGETAKEYETKWNRPIGEFYPDYTQKSQKLSEYEKKEKEAQEIRLKEKVKAKEELSPEEAKKLALEEAGITVNKNTIPGEPASPFYPSGIRLGTPALTTRGMKEKDMSKIASWITAVITDPTVAPNVREEIKRFTKNFPAPGL